MELLLTLSPLIAKWSKNAGQDAKTSDLLIQLLDGLVLANEFHI